MRGVLVLAGVLWSSVALAYDAPPVMSFAKPTANGKNVLVMLHPGDFARSRELKEKYGRSGLYPANDPTKPLWLCDWTADREWNVFVSDDGVYAVRTPNGDPGLRRWLMSNERPIPPRAADWDTAPALFLYKDGKPFRTLTLRDVFDCSRFTDRDCFMGPVVRIEAFRDADGQVSISGQRDDERGQLTATVDFRTGEVIDRGGGGEALRPAPTSRGAPPTAASGGSSGTRSEVAAEERSWGRIILIGLVVVGVCTAVFAGVAVLLVRHRSSQNEA